MEVVFHTLQEFMTYTKGGHVFTHAGGIVLFCRLLVFFERKR